MHLIVTIVGSIAMHSILYHSHFYKSALLLHASSSLFVSYSHLSTSSASLSIFPAVAHIVPRSHELKNQAHCELGFVSSSLPTCRHHFLYPKNVYSVHKQAEFVITCSTIIITKSDATSSMIIYTAKIDTRCIRICISSSCYM